MKKIKGFPSDYHTSPGFEALQDCATQGRLRALWAIHHDDYAPDGSKLTRKDLGGNAQTVASIDSLKKTAISQAQMELDRLNGPL